MSEHIEAVARRLCKIRGLDPDEWVSHGADPDRSGYVPDIQLWSLRWERVAREVKARLEMDQAIREASEEGTDE